MNTYDWAKNELKLARENEIAKCKADPDYELGDEQYGLMCYDAAEQLLDVFEEQGHSGYSARVVCSIFERLVKGKPLTPVTDEDDQWGERYTAEEDPVKRYQHKRMSSLFKHVDADGTVTYRDINRVRAYDPSSVSSQRASSITSRTNTSRSDSHIWEIRSMYASTISITSRLQMVTLMFAMLLTQSKTVQNMSTSIGIS